MWHFSGIQNTFHWLGPLLRGFRDSMLFHEEAIWWKAGLRTFQVWEDSPPWTPALQDHVGYTAPITLALAYYIANPIISLALNPKHLALAYHNNYR